MMLAIFGTPSALTYWVLINAKLAAEIVHGPSSRVTANSLEDLRAQWTQRDHRSVLFHADTPKRDLVDLFVRVPGVAIVVTEPLKTVASFAQAMRSLDPQTALRFATRSVCTLEQFLTRPDVWHIEPDIADLSLDRFVEELATRALPQATQAQIGEMQARLARFNSPSRSVGEALEAYVRKALEARVSVKCLPPDLARAADDFDACVRRERPRMTWPPGVFVRMSDRTYVDSPIEMVGPARVLIGGHSLSVPIGRWKATAEIAVSDNASGNTLFFDVVADGHSLSGGTVRLPESGAFRMELDFECDDPFHPLNLRIAIREGAIEGVLELRHVHMQRLA